MKLPRLLLFTAALSLCSLSFSDDNIDSVDPAVRAEMTSLVQAWIDAEVQSDGTALKAILHEDFLSTFASGTTLDRDAYVDFITALDIPPFSVTNESMVQHGEVIVVIDVSEDGGTKFTWIAAKQNGKWQVISQTFSRVASVPAE